MTTTTTGTDITEGTDTGETTADSPQPRSRDGRPERGAAVTLAADLYVRHGRMVLGLCRLLLRDPVEAEDAAQQTFLSAHRGLLGGAVVRQPAAWLAEIARNECRARIRSRMQQPLDLPELPAELPDPLAAAIRAADLDALWAALSTLPRRQRRVFLLRELGGLSYRELGAALGVSRPAVESLLFRARQRLRDALPGISVAFVPLALRDGAERLVSGLASTSAGAAAVPVAAKVAAVTLGVGLVAAGPTDRPRAMSQPAKRAVHRAPAVAPRAPSPVDGRDTAVEPVRAVHKRGSDHLGSGRGRRSERRADERRERSGPAPAQAEDENKEEVESSSEPVEGAGEEAREVKESTSSGPGERTVPEAAEDSSGSGDGGSQDSHGGGSHDSGGSEDSSGHGSSEDD